MPSYANLASQLIGRNKFRVKALLFQSATTLLQDYPRRSGAVDEDVEEKGAQDTPLADTVGDLGITS